MRKDINKSFHCDACTETFAWGEWISYAGTVRSFDKINTFYTSNNLKVTLYVHKITHEFFMGVIDSEKSHTNEVGNLRVFDVCFSGSDETIHIKRKVGDNGRQDVQELDLMTHVIEFLRARGYIVTEDS